MILIFDLDDTLYDEMSFVVSGLAAVAQHGADQYGWEQAEAYQDLKSILKRESRGQVFDIWLEKHRHFSKGRVAECVKIYRHHRPKLELFPLAEQVLQKYRDEGVPLYLVTDGHKIVQRNKVDALGLWPRLKRVFITHRYGLAAAKPATLCFERIRKIERCDWDQLVYVGDNPAKDFVNLRALGALTIRVLTGGHRKVAARPGYDAHLTIEDLSGLEEALRSRFEGPFSRSSAEIAR